MIFFLNQIDIQHFYDACVNDYCFAKLTKTSVDVARCRSIEALVDECGLHHTSWRSVFQCRTLLILHILTMKNILCEHIFLERQCLSPNTVYVECVSECTRTCYNPDFSAHQCEQSTDDCMPGCICTNDTVYDPIRSECVPLELCTCQYNQVNYQPGDRVSMDCNEW